MKRGWCCVTLGTKIAAPDKSKFEESVQALFRGYRQPTENSILPSGIIMQSCLQNKNSEPNCRDSSTLTTLSALSTARLASPIAERLASSHPSLHHTHLSKRASGQTRLSTSRGRPTRALMLHVSSTAASDLFETQLDSQPHDCSFYNIYELRILGVVHQDTRKIAPLGASEILSRFALDFHTTQW